MSIRGLMLVALVPLLIAPMLPARVEWGMTPEDVVTATGHSECAFVSVAPEKQSLDCPSVGYEGLDVRVLYFFERDQLGRAVVLFGPLWDREIASLEVVIMEELGLPTDSKRYGVPEALGYSGWPGVRLVLGPALPPYGKRRAHLVLTPEWVPRPSPGPL